LEPEQTLIIATHRYSVLDLVDRLVVLSNGRAGADGPKQQVLELLKENAVQGRGKGTSQAITLPVRR